MPEKLPLPREWYKGWDLSSPSAESGPAIGLTEADMGDSKPHRPFRAPYRTHLPRGLTGADRGWHVRQKALLPVQSTLPTSSEREVTWATASLLLQSLTHGNKQLRVWDRMSNSFSQCVRAEVA